MMQDATKIPASRGLSLLPAAQLATAYLTLLKPKITLLLTACGAVAAFVASAGSVPLGRVLLFCGLGLAASGGAAGLNHFFDRDIDARMARTRHRPIPSGRIKPVHAAIFSLGLLAVAVPAAWLLLDPVVALYMIAGALIYSGLYTLVLKRTTSQNIVIGGLAGSCGGLAGWALVDPALSAGAVLFGLLIFLWTPSHFWGLAMARDADYRATGIPMLPQVRGVSHTARAMVAYAVATLAASLALVPLTSLGLVYGGWAVVVGAWNMLLCISFQRHPTARTGIRVFKFSGAYLGLLIIAMAVDVAL